MSEISPHLHIPLSALIEEREYRRCCPKRKKGTAPHEWQKELLDAFVYFCNNYWYIKHPEKGRIKFELYDSQIETVETWLTNRYTLILKARQIGFSTLVATFAFWLTYFWPDRQVVMLSRTERDAIKLLQKAKYGIRFLPDYWKSRPGAPLTNMTQTKIEFTNESVIESLPSASDPARGETAYLVVVDELAFLPNSEEAYNAIEPVADAGGRIIMLSTANGEGNLFHRLWVEASSGNNRFKPLFFPWWANGRTDEWYAAKKEDLLPHMLAQEYPDDPDEAFLKSGNPVFSLDVLREIKTEPPNWSGHLRGQANVPTFVQGWDQVNTNEPLKVWVRPDEEEIEHPRFVIGADVSQGFEHGDYSSAHVINVRNHEVVAHWHGRADPDLFGSEILYWLGRWYHNALIGVESNGHGLTTLKALQRTGYKPIYYQRSLTYKRSKETEVLGWRTTQVSKPLAVDELNQALREKAMKLPCEHTIAELRTYVRDGNGKMHGSPFDDRVMSLAIANQMLKYVWLPQFQPDLAPGPGTVGYFEKLLFGETEKSRKSPRPPIGANYARTR